MDRQYDDLTDEHIYNGMRGSNEVVQLMKRCDSPRGDPDVWWIVMDLVTGLTFRCADSALGRRFTEMEVLAWAARSQL